MLEMKARYKKHILNFKRPSGTSRGIMTQKETWFLCLESNGKKGFGECGLLRGLSIDDTEDYEEKLKWLCDHIYLGADQLKPELKYHPSIQFGLEQALRSLRAQTPFELFPSNFTEAESPITINGLVWMGDKQFMFHQIEEKLKNGFSCIKMKIGAIDFEEEINLLRHIRNRFNADTIELRVDANGAFSITTALEKLERLSAFDIHSIEQPIRQNQWHEMAKLCERSPIPIALDEELISVVDVTKRHELLQTIMPQYLILKPSLLGGFEASEDWISKADDLGIGWWVTSALESNIGLNAIAQWTYTLNSKMPQGLGTGALFTNNIDSPLQVADGQLFYRKGVTWPENIHNILCT